MKNILLLVHDDTGQEARLQAALDLTRALDGHLICLDVARPPVVAGGGMDAASMILLDERPAEARNRAHLEARLSVEDVAWEMRQASGDFADCVIDNAGLADLIVVSRRLDDAELPEMHAVAPAIAMKSGKPVIAVPDRCAGFDVAGRALVAWDGSEPAMAALARAVPLLKLARSVTLFEADDGPPSSVAAAARYLSRYDIHCVVRIVHHRGPVAAQIEHAIEAAGASYCVMGAYGHGPMRETLFGGVTRHMLAHAKVPLFLAH